MTGELPKLDLRQMMENMKALREADPETMDKIMTASMNALVNNPEFMEKLVNTVKGATPDEPKSE